MSTSNRDDGEAARPRGSDAVALLKRVIPTWAPTFHPASYGHFPFRFPNTRIIADCRSLRVVHTSTKRERRGVIRQMVELRPPARSPIT